jgi:hypothetical protein
MNDPHLMMVAQGIRMTVRFESGAKAPLLFLISLLLPIDPNSAEFTAAADR